MTVGFSSEPAVSFLRSFSARRTFSASGMGSSNSANERAGCRRLTSSTEDAADAGEPPRRASADAPPSNPMMVLSKTCPSLLEKQRRHNTDGAQRVPIEAQQVATAAGLFARHSGRHGRRRQFLVGEALTIDAQVLADPLDVVARLVEWNALDPVDEIDRAVTRIAVRRDPLRDPTWTGVVCGEGEFA